MDFLVIEFNVLTTENIHMLIADLICDSTGAPQPEVYFMALIDVLTHYGVKKQAAKAAKTVKYGSSADGISTVEPDQYGKRFLEFMNQAIV